MRIKYLNAGTCATSLVLLSLVISGCVTPRPASRVIGSWDSELHGFPIAVEYTQTTVGIGDTEPVPYSIDGNLITLGTENSQRYRVEFPARDEMIQIDEVTGTEQKYVRSTRDSD